MKKLLLYFLLVTGTNNVFAQVNQGNWRWRFDNGSEMHAGWIAPENTIVSVTNTQPIRLRTELLAASSGTANICLQYSSSLNPSAWTDITNTAGTNAFELSGFSRHIQDNTPTSQQLAGCSEGASYTYRAGTVFVSTEMVDKTINANTKSDFEWVIVPTYNIQPNVTYTFRVANVNWPIALPKVITSATLPVHLANFSAKAESSRTKIQWTTKTEVNNDFFEVERSTDGNTWTTLNKVKGSGTTTEAQTYTSYDHAPLSTTNFYRISQHDLDGRVKTSSVVAVKHRSATKLSMITVYPNPTVKEIRFRLDNVNEKGLTASLTSLDGKIVHSESFATSTTSNLYELNLNKKPAAGTYILSIKGNNISVNERVIVH
jgi:hypothetical protein